MPTKEAKAPGIDASVLQINPSEVPERKPEYMLAPAPYYPEDEISLVDLIRVILTHKATLLAVFVAVSLASLAAVLLMPKQYRYETVIELGSYMLPNEKGILSERRFIEGLDNAKSKLEKRFITQVLNDVAAISEEFRELTLPQFSVEAPKNGNLLILSARWNEDGNDVLQLQLAIANSLVQDHVVLANEILEQARQRKGNYQLELKQLTSRVLSLQQQDKVLSQRLARTAEEKTLYKKQLQRLDSDIDNLVTQKTAYISDQTQPKEAMAILLLDNELKQIRDHRDLLEVKLLISLENRKEELEKSIADNLSAIELARATEENVRSILSRFNIDGVIDTLSVAAASDPLNREQSGQFQLIRPTQVVVAPNRSIRSVGMGRTVQLAIGIMLAALLAIIACFVAELVSKVRTETSKESQRKDDLSSDKA